jgi:hypothetical protein
LANRTKGKIMIKASTSAILCSALLLLSATLEAAAPVRQQSVTWSKTTSVTNSGDRDIVMAFFKGYLYVGGEHGLRRTNDGGVTWQGLTAPAPLVQATFNQAVEPWSMVQKDQALFVSYRGSIAKTTNGTSFIDVTPPSGSSPVHSMTVAGIWLFVSTDNEFLKSRSGTSWLPVNATVAVPEETTGRYSTLYTAGTGSFLNKSTDYGITWQATTMPVSSGLYSVGNFIYGNTNSGTGIVRYDGVSTTAVGTPNVSMAAQNCCAPIAAAGSVVLAGGAGDKVSILRQGTTQWSPWNGGFASGTKVYSLAVDRAKCKVFAGTNEGVWTAILDPSDCTPCVSGNAC